MKIKELYTKFLECNMTICTDTRKIIPGSLFLALKGANFNGNEFAAQAIHDGAKYAVIDETDYEGEGTILVKNVLKTLQDLANFHRNKFEIPVLGITGSNGKTTTKELIAAVLEKQYNVLVTEGNLNNHLGVPFTLLKLRKEHEIAVVEMGANKPGDIEELCEIALPDLGIITNIGKAHIEGFGSFEGVIKTKTELYEAVASSGGVVFMNADDPVLLRHAPACDIYTYGAKGQVKSEMTGLDPYLSFKWSAGGEQSPEIQSHLVGSYNLPNFTAAVCIGLYFDITSENICSALSEYTPTNNRSQISKIKTATIIVDCYNANPTSMMGALENFLQMEGEDKLAIIGDMKELGTISDEEHQKVVDWVKETKINTIFIGQEFAKFAPKDRSYSTVGDYIELIKSQGVIGGKNILLKGSRSIQLEKLLSDDLYA